MITEILLIHHSHTDIGFTHPQPVIFELHDRFIEEALDLADATANDPEHSRFKWTCEVTGTTLLWWEKASGFERDRFLAAVKRGQIEVAAMQWHLTPLADLPMLVHSMENVRFFRELGIPVRSAMNTDVNGVPWGLVEVLLDHDIAGFSMSINSHLGGPVTPRPGAFRWASPSGREILVWNGFQYWQAAQGLMKIPNSVEEVAGAMPGILAEAEKRGYPLTYLPIQITSTTHPDNAGPDPNISPFVREWNARNPSIRIRTALLSDIFDRLRTEDLPVMSGDWTDYWNLGAGSSARETTVLLEGQRVLDAARQMASWPGEPLRREAGHIDAAFDNLALYAEHTWGADCSISSPDSIETRMQWATKSAFAFQGLSHARIVARDALHRLALEAGGDEPTLLLYNSLPFPVSVPVRLPSGNLDWALTPGEPHRQRLDAVLNGLPENDAKWCRVDLPALGYRTYPAADLPLASSEGLESSPSSLASNRVKIEFLPSGGVGSLKVDGVEYASTCGEFVFGVPILERPTGGSRRDIMKLDFSKFEPADGWQRDWERTTVPGTLTDSAERSVEGAAEFRQSFSMDNGDKVELNYRLFADDPSVAVEVSLRSAGDSRPYSLALPFILPESGPTTWHFDTAGALLEFDRDQLPDACMHYVTSRRFVRMQTGSAALSIATPDLPLWKFGGMFFAPASQLNASDRRPITLAWLANNYWEVNFLANQTGQTKYRLQLLPSPPEAVDASYSRAMPYAVPPRLHAYRDLGPVRRTEDSLMRVEGGGISVESIERQGESYLVSFMNLRSEANRVAIAPVRANWTRASLARLDGTAISQPGQESDGSWRADIPARGLCTLRLSP